MIEIALLIALTGTLWGVGPIFDKTAISYFSNENTIFLRVLSGMVFITIFTLVFGNPGAILSEFHWKGMLAVLGSAIAGFMGVYTFYRVISIPGASISTSYAIALAICPIVTAILANIFYGEALFQKAKIFGILFIVIGIFLVSKEQS